MPEYILYLFYLSLLLLLGILITAFANKLKLSNILFLILMGYLLKIYNLDFFNNDIVLVLSSLALIVIVIETTMELDIAHVIKNFIHVLKFSIVFFILCVYTLTLLVFQLFDFPGKGFDIFILCILLSIIIYGADPSIVMEFFKEKKSKVKEILRIEGIISGPIVVLFAFFLIGYFNTSQVSLSKSLLSPLVLIFQQVFLALIISFVLAYLFHKIVQHFPLTQELYALAVIALGIAIFAMGQTFNTNGTLAVAFYGIFLRALTKKPASKKYNSVFAHTLYLIVFILLGIQFVFPEPLFWVKGIGLFVVYLLLRFASVYLFFRKINLKEKIFMTLNTAKGIEVAFVLLIINLNFSYIDGLDIIVSLGFMFFILSYIISTITNHFSSLFFEPEEKRASAATA